MPKVSEAYRQARREHVLEAARRCFVRDGFHATSMQDLVDEAGMSAGAVYRYFPSKNTVIEAIAVENLEQVVAVLRDALTDTGNPSRAMSAVLDYVAARHAEDGFAAVALLVWSEALRNATLAAALRSAFDAMTALLDAADPKHTSDALICVLPGYLMQLALRGPAVVAEVPGVVARSPVASAGLAAE